jgi:hypothetical protein
MDWHRKVNPVNPDPALDEFFNNIINCFTGNAAYPALPVLVPDLTILNTKFRDAISQAAGGGLVDTAAKKKARAALEDAGRKNAGYVEIIASHDLETLLSSGYLPASTNKAQSPLDQPMITELSNLASTQLLLRITPINTAKAYQVQTSINGGVAWQEAGIFTQARRIVLMNLVPGTLYNVRVRAIGGSTGASEWSQPMPQMAT